MLNLDGAYANNLVVDNGILNGAVLNGVIINGVTLTGGGDALIAEFQIESSNANNMVITNSQIQDTTLDNVTLTNTTIEIDTLSNANIIDGTIGNNIITDSTANKSSNCEQHTDRCCAIHNLSITGTFRNNATVIEGSTIIDSDINNGYANNLTVNASSFTDGTIFVVLRTI